MVYFSNPAENFMKNANKTISEQRRYLERIKKGGPIAEFINAPTSHAGPPPIPLVSPHPYPYYPVSYGPGYGPPSPYDLFGGAPSLAIFQQMSFMLSFMTQLMDQAYLGGFPSRPGGSHGGNDSGGNTPSGLFCPEEAQKLLKEIIKKNDYESTQTDSDSDGHIISQEDLERIKKAITQNKFTEADLQHAFHEFLLEGGADDSKKMDEILALFNLAESEGYVSYQNLFNPALIRGLRQERRDQLAAYLGGKDLARNEQGLPHTKVVNFLIRALDPSSTQSLQDFTKTLVRKYVENYVIPGTPSANATATLNFLRLQGFAFNPDGTLRPDPEQPFPVGIPTP